MSLWTAFRDVFHDQRKRRTLNDLKKHARRVELSSLDPTAGAYEAGQHDGYAAGWDNPRAKPTGGNTHYKRGFHIGVRMAKIDKATRR